LEPGADGDLYTAGLSVSSSSHPLDGNQLVVLRKSAHGMLPGFAVGSECRIVGAKTKPDGRLRADLSTVVMANADLPALGYSVQ
jgi:hypothetical protein